MKKDVMMITSQNVIGSIDNKVITATKEITHGVEHYSYKIESLTGTHKSGKYTHLINFQVGNPVFSGFNGITIESLLAVCKHRLDNFQITDYNCKENELAIKHITKALDALKARTKRIQEEKK